MKRNASNRRGQLMRYMFQPLLQAACICAVLAAGVAHAANDAVVLTFENDSFTGTDGSYSAGLGLTLATDEMSQYEPASKTRRWVAFFSFLPFIEDDGYRTYASWTLGQEMHTPEDITDPNPPLDDQPYAGILYLDNVFHARKGRWGHTWSLRMGVAGPASHAAEMQRWAHDLVDSDKPRGWHTQLPNEPLLNVNYSAAYIWRTGRLGDADWRLVPSGGVAVGNYVTGAHLGLYGEVGWNLTDALGLSTLRDGFSAASILGAGPLNAWSVSLFGGGAAYGMAHYLPLDGTLFRDSRSVDSKPAVGLFTVGLAVRHRSLVFTLAHTQFTETFETDRSHAQFGTLSLSLYF